MEVVVGVLAAAARAARSSFACVTANLDSLGLLWLSRRLEGAVREELKWKSLVEKGRLPSGGVKLRFVSLGSGALKGTNQCMQCVVSLWPLPGFVGALTCADHLSSAFAPTLKCP